MQSAPEIVASVQREWTSLCERSDEYWDEQNQWAMRHPRIPHTYVQENGMSKALMRLVAKDFTAIELFPKRFVNGIVSRTGDLLVGFVTVKANPVFVQVTHPVHGFLGIVEVCHDRPSLALGSFFLPISCCADEFTLYTPFPDDVYCVYCVIGSWGRSALVKSDHLFWGFGRLFGMHDGIFGKYPGYRHERTLGPLRSGVLRDDHSVRQMRRKKAWLDVIRNELMEVVYHPSRCMSLLDTGSYFNRK
jgi:hypothetical protein